MIVSSSPYVPLELVATKKSNGPDESPVISKENEFDTKALNGLRGVMALYVELEYHSKGVKIWEFVCTCICVMPTQIMVFHSLLFSEWRVDIIGMFHPFCLSVFIHVAYGHVHCKQAKH